jgi:23S rRNA pseudouridine1911/1915/1917 synthase
MNNISIIFEDNNMLVIDKPAGVTVNKSETTIHEMTIQDWAEDKLKISLPIAVNKKDKIDTFNAQEVFLSRAGIVHRLDKETSGILLIAKKIEAFENLQKQFKERTVKKTYISLAHGKITPDEGEINVPVGRLPWNRKQFGIIPGGRESKTLYKVLKYYYMSKSKEIFTLVELYPQSGRTHQIRVHLKYIGHPVFADFLYAGRKTSRKDRLLLSRVFLHAAKIIFAHPETGEEMSFASDLPPELLEVLNNFKTV